MKKFAIITFVVISIVLLFAISIRTQERNQQITQEEFQKAKDMALFYSEKSMDFEKMYVDLNNRAVTLNNIIFDILQTKEKCAELDSVLAKYNLKREKVGKK